MIQNSMEITVVCDECGAHLSRKLNIEDISIISDRVEMIRSEIMDYLLALGWSFGKDTLCYKCYLRNKEGENDGD